MRLGRNLLAGLAASTLTVLVGLLATPFHLHFLGLERYGLIAFFLTVQALLGVMDMGLSPTVNREVARGMAQADLAPARNLLHTLGLIYALVAAAMVLALVASAPWLAQHWLQARQADVAELARAIAWMGLAVGLRWPAGLYLGAVNGAQRLALSSSLTAAYTAFAGVGSVLALWLVSPRLEVFFAWQALAALAYSLAMRSAAWRVLGSGAGARAGWSELGRVWRFSVGMGLIAVTSVVFTQLDKVLLSRLLGLDAFARYALAAFVAAGLYALVTPVFNALYPRFSALVAAGASDELATLYGLATQALAMLVFPVALLLGFHARPLVELWTQDAAIAVQVAPIIALLCAGSALHAVMYVPYALQLASGMPGLSMRINGVMIVLMVPLTVALTLAHGEIGAATAWLALHAFYVGYGTWMTHRRLLPGQARAWLARDVGLPLLLTLAVGALAYAAGGMDVDTLPALLAWAMAMWAAAVALMLGASPALRAAIRPHVPRLVRTH